MTLYPQAQTGLPGRGSELHRLHALLGAAEVGLPQFAAIEGPAGIGKSTLVDTFLAQHSAPRHVVRLRPEDRRSPGALVQRFLTSITGRRDHRWPGTAREGVQAVYAALLAQLTHSHGASTVLVLEDLHWCDPLSAEVLWRCATGQGTGAFLIVLTYRPHQSALTAGMEALLAGGRPGVLLRPGPLEAAECRQVLEDHLGLPVSEDTARRVHAGTGGVPLLLDTVVRWLEDAPAGHRRLPEALASLGAGPGIPADTADDTEDDTQLVGRALDARRASLDPHARDAVDLLSIAAGPLHIIQLSGALTALGHPGVPDHRLLAPAGVEVFPLTGTVGWTHPHLAGLMARRLPPDRRARLHRVLAGVLKGSAALDHRVSAHRLDPDPAETPDLVASLMQAGQEALALRDGTAAFHCLHRALTMVDDPAVLALALRASVLAHRPDLVLDLRPELDRLPDSRPVRAARAWELLAAEDLDGAVDQIRCGLELPEEDPTRPGLLVLGHALAAAGRLAYASARFDAASGLMDELGAELEPVRQGFERMAGRDPGAMALVAEAHSVEALLALWSGLRHGDRARVGQFTTEMKALVRDLRLVPGTESVQTVILAVVGSRLRAQGEVAAAHRVLDACLRAAPGTPDQRVFVESTLSLLAFHRGTWDRAFEHATRALDLALMLAPDAGIRSAVASAALVPLARGERQAGERLLHRAEGGDGPAGDVVTCAVAYARALGAVFADDHEEAVRQFRIIESTPVGWATAGFTTVCLYARSLAETGRTADLERLAEEGTTGMASAPAGVLAAVRAAVFGALHRARREPDAAARQLLAAVAALDAEPAPYAVSIGPDPLPGGGHALTRALLALDLARLPGATGDWAREAADFFLRCGAADQLRQASAWATGPASATGGPPLRPDADAARTGFELLSRLSTRERQIAVELSRGKGTREIAADLFLTIREVEHHVDQCMVRLGVGDRDELREVLRPATLSMLAPVPTGED